MCPMIFRNLIPMRNSNTERFFVGLKIKEKEMAVMLFLQP